MAEKFLDFAYGFLSKVDIDSDDDLVLMVILYVANTFAAVMHITLFAVYAVSGVWSMAVINMASVALYCLGLVLVKKRRFTACGLLLPYEVSLYVVASAFLVGNDIYSILYIFLALMLQFTAPYAGLRSKIVVIACLWVSLAVSLLKGLYLHPVYLLSPHLTSILRGVNTNFTFIGTIASMTIGAIARRFVASFHDRKMRSLEQQAYTDPLTGLYNRRYAELFFKRIHSGQEPEKWCVALMDIDDFKKVNDTYGHNVGDQVLIHISQVLRQTLRKTDQLFRWGGEEFLVLLENVDLPTAHKVLHKVVREIDTAVVREDGLSVSVTATIGVSPLAAGDITGSIEQCDQKMYYGKQHGKNQVVV